MPGLKKTVLGALAGKLMAQATVEEVEVLSSRFRLIMLRSEKFKNSTMQPAAKVRLNAGNWEMRAYTPLSIDTVGGRMQILAYLHGEAPGSMWVRSAQPGDHTHILGPQQSLDLIGLSQPVVFFGDETSFAAAKTIQTHLSPSKATRFVFETASADEARTVGDRLELRDVQYFERRTGDAHLPSVAEEIQRALAGIATPHLVLTGNGRSIQAIRASLRTHHPGVVDYHVKAYWAPAKTGLE